jgi:hypothetical protein
MNSVDGSSAHYVGWRSKIRTPKRPSLLAAVALLTDFLRSLARGQVGTMVEQLDDKTSLVEFSDEQGRA